MAEKLIFHPWTWLQNPSWLLVNIWLVMVVWTFDSLCFHQSCDSWAPSCSKRWKKPRGLAEKFSLRRVTTWIGLCGNVERIFNALSKTRWRKGTDCMLVVIQASAELLFWLRFTIDCMSSVLASPHHMSSCSTPNQFHTFQLPWVSQLWVGPATFQQVCEWCWTSHLPHAAGYLSTGRRCVTNGHHNLS